MEFVCGSTYSGRFSSNLMNDDEASLVYHKGDELKGKFRNDSFYFDQNNILLFQENGVSYKYTGELYQQDDTFFPMGSGTLWQNKNTYMRATFFDDIYKDDITFVDMTNSVL